MRRLDVQNRGTAADHSQIRPGPDDGTRDWPVIVPAICMNDFSNSTNPARREGRESDPLPEMALDEGLISDTGAFCFNPPFLFLIAS